MTAQHTRVYWANGMFSAADRAFNLDCAERLRAAGLSVFLPQESTENAECAPSAVRIFRQDSAAILRSDVVVACLDQETIDPGVCCEIGVAYSAGVPLIGLYTDVRQYRAGPGRMYKNLYVVGAIEASLGVVSSVDQLVAKLCGAASKSDLSTTRPSVVEVFSESANNYESFVSQLEGWYSPPWSTASRLTDFVRRTPNGRVLDIGCGPGATAGQLLSEFPSLSYVGLDTSARMLELAKGRELGNRAVFTDSLEVAAALGPFDTVLAAFTLHDHPHPVDTLAFALAVLAPAGTALIIDLATSDLPLLVERLKQTLASPARIPDSRLDPARTWEMVRSAGGVLASASWHVTRIGFPTANDLDRYLRAFGIYDGCDLPLGLSAGDPSLVGSHVKSELAQWQFPFTDHRCFAEIVITR